MWRNGNSTSGIEDIIRILRQGTQNLQWVIDRRLFTPEQIGEFGNIEPCSHETLVVAVIVTQCPECGATFHHRPDEETDTGFKYTLLKVHQGIITADEVIGLGNFTEAQKTALWMAVRCEHKNPVEYDCRCSHKTKWRCPECGLVRNTRDEIERLGRQDPTRTVGGLIPDILVAV